ncbi:MAG: DNA double-strand break repair nuclease NurA [Methanobacteriota archaeon]
MRSVSGDELEAVARYVAKASTENFEGAGGSDAEGGILQVKGPILPERFIPINGPRPCERSAAIDGGSATVLDCGSFVVGAISAGHAISDAHGACRTDSHIRLIGASHADKKSIYREIFSKAMGAEPTDYPKSLDSLVGRLRNIAELEEAAKVVSGAPEGSLVMIDGALWAGLGDFAPLIEKLVKSASQRSVCLAGVSKRSMLYFGYRPLVPYLARLGKKTLGDSLWAYPVALAEYEGRTFGATYVAHLHPMAQFAFRVDVNPMPGFAADETIAMLAGLSDDPGYVGYPYPLARVHNEVAIGEETRRELQMGLKRTLTSSGGDAALIEEFSRNFHDILDGGI